MGPVKDERRTSCRPKDVLRLSDVSSNGTGVQIASGELLNFELGSLSRLRPETNFWKHLSEGTKKEAAMPNSRKFKLSSRSFGLSVKNDSSEVVE